MELPATEEHLLMLSFLNNAKLFKRKVYISYSFVNRIRRRKSNILSDEISGFQPNLHLL